jgi:Calcium-dependent channel, 7TM region, putative phosphate
MVFLVYAVISPITSFVIALCFAYMGSMFRHQFVYIYPAQPDSGGKIWMEFIRILLVCLLVAEVTSTFDPLMDGRYLHTEAHTLVDVVDPIFLQLSACWLSKNQQFPFSCSFLSW